MARSTLYEYLETCVVCIQDRIERFCSWFEREIKKIDQLTIGSEMEEPRFQKALYLMVVDALAKIRYDGEWLRNRERFVRVIRDHGNWPDCERESVPILRRRLGETCSTPLADHLDNLLRTHGRPPGMGTVDVAKIDPTAQELLELAGSKKESQEMEHLHHFNLLYTYRNYLIHEARQPGFAMDGLGDEDRAYYHSYISDPNLRLAYPVGLVRRLATSVLDSVGDWLSDQEVDPYDRVAESLNWDGT